MGTLKMQGAEVRQSGSSHPRAAGSLRIFIVIFPFFSIFQNFHHGNYITFMIRNENILFSKSGLFICVEAFGVTLTSLM